MGQEFEEKIEGILKRLPKLAIVAFAVRCAWRVFPLLEPLLERGGSKAKHVDVLKRALSIAEEFAGGSTAEFVSDLTRSAGGIISGAHSATVEAINCAACAADDAAYAAKDAVTYYPANAGRAAARSAAGVATWSIRAAAYATEAAGGNDSVSATRRLTIEDAEHLLRLSDEGGWDDETPVEQFVFGTMWPDDTPDWARSDTKNSDGDVLELHIELDGDLSDEDVTEKVLALLEDADGVCYELGGGGLVIDEIQIESEKGAGVGEPV